MYCHALKLNALGLAGLAYHLLPCLLKVCKLALMKLALQGFSGLHWVVF